MAAVIDLLQDVEQKFSGTVVMYKDKAVLIKTVSPDEEKAGHFRLHSLAQGARSYEYINLFDPALNYQRFNIGYANGGGVASWWYRKPHKQWSQGLKSNQMGYKVGNPGTGPHDNFNFQKPFTNMLENIYPDIETCKKALMNKDGTSMAFHRDFALSFDDLHDDYLLEYHGQRIGTSIDSQLKQFKIKSEAKHLIEALQEARDVHP